MELKGRVALITGGGRRVGKHIALRLAEEGMDIIVNYRKSEDDALETVRSIKQKGTRGLAIKGDIGKLEECDSIIRLSVAKFGKVDVLVNNASDFLRTPFNVLFSRTKDYENIFEELVSVHMKGAFYLAGRLGIEMKRRGWGRIINITDRCTIKGTAYKDYGLYIASKYGLYGINQVLAEELAPEVLVNAIAPGLVIAPDHFSYEEIQRMRERLPLKHEVGPEEIAEEVAHLIKSSGRTGSTILIDAGIGVHTL